MNQNKIGIMWRLIWNVYVLRCTSRAHRAVGYCFLFVCCAILTVKYVYAVEDPEVLSELEQEKVLVFTPSRKVRGKRIVCHDDRYIVKLATETDGVIVSNDTYRDLVTENEHFRKTIEERLLMYSFVDDRWKF